MTSRTAVNRWCFTINNYTEEVVSAVEDFAASSQIVYLIYGKEVGQNGTPHLQGFLILNKSQRLTWVSRRLPTAHFEKARASSEANRAYCQKEGDFKEYGVFPQNQGKRTDLDRVIAWSDEFCQVNGHPPSESDLAEEYPHLIIKYPRLCHILSLRAPRPVLQDGTPNDWQKKLEERLQGPADDRSILFYVDEAGGKGKTWFQRYYLTKYEKTQMFTIAQRDDTAFMVDTSTKVFFFNIPRTAMGFLNYHLLEQLKDRVVQSNKYHSCVKLMHENVHVVVFSNEYPDHSKMSEDRYVICEF